MSLLALVLTILSPILTTERGLAYELESAMPLSWSAILTPKSYVHL